MQKGFRRFWRALGLPEKIFLLCVSLYAILYFTRAAPNLQWWAGFLAFFLGLFTLFRVARRAIRGAIWRLRNRLIVAYLFIAVVPVVLILALVGIAGWAVIGQMAIYLVNTELQHREQSLLRPAETLVRFPGRDPDTVINRFANMIRSSFPNFELVATGNLDIQYPPESRLKQPPPSWKQASGLVIKNDGGEDRLYAWAHVVGKDSEVTVLAPITPEMLASLVPGLGDISLVPLVGRTRESQVPPAANALDFGFRDFYPLYVPHWDSPDQQRLVTLLVQTRLSAVLGTVFGQKLEWGELAFAAFVVLSALFFLVEMASLVAGVKLSRTITGAVHELYEATQHVKEGDFSYRIPVKGNDQLAELGSSFNTMTENLGRLIVVAKEKERLESELAIAREVQNQLFPKDVPFTRTLELKGVCNPARMVSGDYYDFVALSDTALAFAIGDVAGKGISAALLMATIQSTMRTQLTATNGSGPQHLSTAHLVANLNKQLWATTSPEKYATFYFAVYDDQAQALTYTNAGHLAPILVRGNTLSTLESTGTVVGAFPIARYGEKTVRLEQGDLLVAYTDGIVEPENAYGEMFGEERLKDLIMKHAHADSSEIIARTMEAVNQWTGAGELQDDMTMVVARRL
ncbi:MAG TPA: SpoIIE family protein phosphatase [Bryobacteraceae bacterium]